MKTRTELIARALRNLGALPQGQTPSVEASQSLDDLIDSMLAELDARDILSVDPDQDFEEEVSPARSHPDMEGGLRVRSRQ
jgi:hypothetical protein